jgi:hypothetical protein
MRSNNILRIPASAAALFELRGNRVTNVSQPSLARAGVLRQQHWVRLDAAGISWPPKP